MVEVCSPLAAQLSCAAPGTGVGWGFPSALALTGPAVSACFWLGHAAPGLQGQISVCDV